GKPCYAWCWKIMSPNLGFEVKKGYDLESEGYNAGGSGEVGTMADIPASDLYLNGVAFVVSSDWPGKKKISLVGQFEWNVDTTWRLVDKMSIGYPTTNQWYWKTSSTGGIMGFENQVCNLYNPGGWVCDAIQYTPSDATNGAGVAGSFDLAGDSNYTKGHISQYVYVDSTKTGTSNVLFRYGHRIYSGNVSVGLFPAGLAVEPGYYTETRDFWITFSW
ncbi:hypothetical protein, partial [uncultured Paenibacillus sp.]|uniref:hypothetical protein n=1 Tax=uncultured Paenibacillus sp. TaxID=227322 RepID=UPI0028D68B4E